MKLKYQEKVKSDRMHLCRHCKNVETRSKTSNYELNRPLSKEKISNWINER